MTSSFIESVVQAAALKPYTGEYKQQQVVLPREVVVDHTDLTQKAEVLGKPAIVRQVHQFLTLVTSLDIAIVRLKNDIIVNNSFLLLKTENFQINAYGYANGRTVLELSRETVPGYRFSLPSRVLKTFNQIATHIFELISNIVEASVSLMPFLNVLLERLPSGKIKVKETERIGDRTRK